MPTIVFDSLLDPNLTPTTFFDLTAKINVTNTIFGSKIRPPKQCSNMSVILEWPKFNPNSIYGFPGSPKLDTKYICGSNIWHQWDINNNFEYDVSPIWYYINTIWAITVDIGVLQYIADKCRSCLAQIQSVTVQLKLTFDWDITT